MSGANFHAAGARSRAARNPDLSGFTLVEILIVVIILGILAAIVIPQFNGAVANSKAQAVRSELQTLRAAIQLYRVEHKDRTPDLVGSNWAVFMQPTDADGNVVAPPSGYGPYLHDEPHNALAESDTISDAPGAGVAWVYDMNAGTIWATQDPDGTLLDETSVPQ